ncbi:MAG: hypothetical protein ACK5C5_05555 [Bacteroidota bacterium]|jgi:iron-sulfur cluster repair protein YtfE (RIC family)
MTNHWSYQQAKSRFDSCLGGQSLHLAKETEMSGFVRLLATAFDDVDSFSYEKFNAFDLHLLTEYVSSTHKLYINKSLQEIEQWSEHCMRNMVVQENLKSQLHTAVRKFKVDTIEHIQEEESTLLPYLRLLNCDYNRLADYDSFWIEKSKCDLTKFHDEHEDEHLGLQEIDNIIGQLCKAGQRNFLIGMLEKKIKTFCTDLQIHGNIEEMVIIPKAVETERKLIQKYHKLLSKN